MINKKRKPSQQEDITDLCPLYKQQQETQQHIYQCTQQQARKNRIKGLWQIRNYCQSKNTFPPVIDIITKHLHKWMDKTTITQPTEDSIQNHYKTITQETRQLIRAIRNQSEIGWNRFSMVEYPKTGGNSHYTLEKEKRNMDNRFHKPNCQTGLDHLAVLSRK